MSFFLSCPARVHGCWLDSVSIPPTNENGHASMTSLFLEKEVVGVVVQTSNHASMQEHQRLLVFLTPINIINRKTMKRIK